MLKDGSLSDLQTTCDLNFIKIESEEVRFVTTYWKKEKKQRALIGWNPIVGQKIIRTY